MSSAVSATSLSNPSLDDAIKLKMLIRESGKTQAKIADEIGVDRTYLSQMVNGKVSWTNSRYFPALVQALGMREEQVKAVKPSAVITLSSEPPAQAAPFDPRTLFHPPANRRREKRPLSPNLAEMIEDKQEKYPALKETRWQQHLNQTRFSDGKEPEAEGWFEMFQAMRRNNVEPEEWPDDC